MNKNETYLICTNIRETWPENKKKNLVFSSEAALDYFPKENFEYSNFQTNSYHWSNKDQLIKDFKYIENFYEKILVLLGQALNKTHSIDYSINFWRILIGPWLGTFIFILFDRWKNVETAKKNFQIDKMVKLHVDPNLFVPYEAEDFIKLTQNDLWNQMIYQNIYPYFFEKIKIEENELSNLNFDKVKNSFRQKKDEHSSLKNFFFKLFDLIDKRKYKYLVFRTYTGIWNEIRLSIKIKQFPIFLINKNNSYSKKNINKELRTKLNNIYSSVDKFENFALKNIIYFIPKVFLENFSDLINFSKNSNLPSKPKKIISSNALWYDSFFMFHAARLIENGSKLIYGQHGGAYGISAYSWPEEHEKKISNKYLSWGWSDDGDKKNTKKFFVILKKKKFKWKKNKMKNLLILMRHRKVYFQSPETSAGTELYSDYMKYCNDFFNSVSKEIKKKIILRLPYKNLTKESIDFFSNLNDIKLDSADSFEKACNNSKIVVNTANSTTFCETLSNNIPSILLLKKENNPIRKEALNIFEDLEENNLIFFDSFKASKFINKIWHNDIKNWWFEEKTQNALNSFKMNYARRSKDIVNDYFKEISNDD